MLGKGDGVKKDIGESWELSDREGNASVVEGGTFTGENLRKLFSLHARDILGSQYSPSLSRFPLLYKFIHAKDDLSVQVHPGEGSPLGEAKTECWYILDAPKGASLILGLKASAGGSRAAGAADRERTLEALKSKDCLSVLNRIPVRAGDLFFIPAGTVHAITAGLLLYELQQNSDTTFRLYDWDRVDAAGKPRQLHVKESGQVLDFRVHDKHRIEPLAIARATHREEFLVACRHFALVRWSDCHEQATLGKEDRFKVITCTRGAFEISWDGVNVLPVNVGETVLIPAACDHPRLIESIPGSEALVSFIPDLEADVAAPLRAAGRSEREILDLGGLDGFRP